jgi:hypothetical protein
MKPKFTSDIDIDLANRDSLLSIIDHTAARMATRKEIRRHATGVYVTDIPYDASANVASIDYQAAEIRGYVKLDLLNVNVYNDIKDERHLVEMMAEPNWSLLADRKFVEQLIHINRHFSTIKKMPEPINSIPRLAMFLAIIRPAKRHLIGKKWSEVAETVWQTGNDGYGFKRAHACAYAHLVVVNMNLLESQIKASALQG